MMPDGRILGVVAAGQTQSAESTTPQIQVVLNWFEELKQRVPSHEIAGRCQTKTGEVVSIRRFSDPMP